MTALQANARNGRRGHLGVGVLSDARRVEVEPVSPRGDRGGGDLRAADARAHGRARLRAGAPRLLALRRFADDCGRRCASRTARSIGVATTRRRCCARSAPSDGSPGVRDEIAGLPCYLYDAHREGRLRGAPGAIVAQRDGAICRATGDGAIWITHLKRADDRRGVQASRRDGSRRRDRGGPRGAVAGAGSRRLSDVAPDSLRRGRAGRVPALSLLQRCDGHRAVRGAARRLCVCALAFDARDRTDGRGGLLVERNSLESDRGLRASCGRIVAQHQRHRRPGPRHRRHRSPAHARGALRQCRRRRRVPGARRGSRLRPRRRRPEPALQRHGQSVRIGILDLSSSAPCRSRARAGRSSTTGSRSACARRSRWA